MDVAGIIIISFIGVAVISFIVFIFSRITNTLNQNRVELQGKIDGLNEKISQSASDNYRAIQEQFKQSSAIIKEVTTSLTKIDETNKQVLDFSKQIREGLPGFYATQ